MKVIVNILKGGKSPVQDGIVAGLLLAAIVWFINQYVTEIWKPITDSIKFVWTILQKKLETPIFLLALSGVGNFVALAMLARFFIARGLSPSTNCILTTLYILYYGDGEWERMGTYMK